MSVHNTDLRNYTNDHNLDLDQDPLHPLGIWNDIHASTDNFFWRVTNGTGAFGPGGIVAISQNLINIGEKNTYKIYSGEERPGFDHTTFDQIGHYAYTSTMHHQGYSKVIFFYFSK